MGRQQKNKGRLAGVGSGLRWGRCQRQPEFNIPSGLRARSSHKSLPPWTVAAITIHDYNYSDRSGIMESMGDIHIALGTIISPLCCICWPFFSNCNPTVFLFRMNPHWKHQEILGEWNFSVKFIFEISFRLCLGRERMTNSEMWEAGETKGQT